MFDENDGLTFTDDEIKTLSPNGKIAYEALKAYRNGGGDKAWGIVSKAELPAHTLMAFKRVYGSDWIREQNLNCRQAENRYGANWLDK